jgi:antirestriction protein
MKTQLDLNADIIDVRDIIARVEELEGEMPDGDNARNWEDADEYATLTSILEDLQGQGGDEQWRGDWYPVTLIAESYFIEYAQELVCEVENLGDLPHYVQIDWEATARNVAMDYSTVEVDGIEYLFR